MRSALGWPVLVAVAISCAGQNRAAVPESAPAAPPAFPGATVSSNNLAWDALTKEYSSKPYERFAHFSFWFTNVSPSEVQIFSAQTSCFCTVAKLPSQPWRIPAGSNGPIEVTMDLAGKSGLVMKGVMVDTTAGRYNLIVKTTVPPTPGPPPQPTMSEGDRLKNMQAALADRQAIFKRSECVGCHLTPAKGQTDGARLYVGVCSNCHDSPFRASVVPDLKALNHPTDLEHWKRWIAFGRAGSMMPAFTEAEGGPLNDQQILAIAQYLQRTVHPETVIPPTPGGGGSGTATPPPAPAR